MAKLLNKGPGKSAVFSRRPIGYSCVSLSTKSKKWKVMTAQCKKAFYKPRQGVICSKIQKISLISL